MAEAGQCKPAALVAADLADLHYTGLGNEAAGHGWVRRAQRLLQGAGRCVEWGYVRLALVACSAGDPDDLEQAAEEALQLAVEFGDSELEVRALADSGYALVVQGQLTGGFGRLDEAMASLSAGEVRNASVRGKAFCALLSACGRTGDLRRAEEWTGILSAMAHDPRRKPSKVLQTHCRLVYGSVLCSVGRRQEGETALLDVLSPDSSQFLLHRATAAARLAKLRLLEGRYEEATELVGPYRDRPECAEVLSRLHLLAGEYDVAAVTAEQALETVGNDRLQQALLLGLLVEIELGRDDVIAAGQHAEAMTRLALLTDSASLRAQAALAAGRVAGARSGDVRDMVGTLREALRLLEGRDCPLLHGTIALELAQALATSGDLAQAVVEARSAQATFHRIGAAVLRSRSDALLVSLGAEGPVLSDLPAGEAGAGWDHRPAADRMLLTVLFTDIVASTARAASMGDHRWRALLDDHDAIVARETARFRGRLVKSTGDGVLATFGTPGPAVRCAGAIRDALREIGIDVRAGVHAGEVGIRGADIGGIAVHIAQRVCGAASGGEILVSSTVKDLVAGSGLPFVKRGLEELRGVEGDWQLFTALP